MATEGDSSATNKSQNGDTKTGNDRKRRFGGSRFQSNNQRKKGKLTGQRGQDSEKRNDWREYKRRKVDSAGAAIESRNPFSKDEIAAEERRPKRKVAVMIGYSGAGYKGMQVNGDEPTIERDLFRAFVAAGAISKANADDPRKSSLARCARTDKGVHAAGNVISLKLIIEDDDIVQRINATLPEQIRIWGIQRTNNSFNCYQYCDSRFYEYLLPSYCLLPPHPQTYLGQKLVEMAKEHGGEEELAAHMADVKDFWADVEERDIKTILAKLDPQVRATVVERLHSMDDPEAEKEVDDVETTVKDSAGVEKESTAAATDDVVETTATESTEEKKSAAGNAEVEKESAVAGDIPAHDEADAAVPATTKGEPEPATKSNIVLPSFKPKGRELTPVDFALRDIKAAYMSAKRRYRVTPERLEWLREVLGLYQGTHDFHNYTVQKAYGDPSAKRTIKSFVVAERTDHPALGGGDDADTTEWLSLRVHGQSFMMHQIRKMVGLAVLVVRCGTPASRAVTDSYGPARMAIPKAPGLGLLLERPVFASYNRRAADNLGRAEIDFGQYAEDMEAFKEREIYGRIFAAEESEGSFQAFFGQIDQFRSRHFLWLTAGGLAVADMGKEGGGGKREDVDGRLGDEDEEDPEGGEG